MNDKMSLFAHVLSHATIEFPSLKEVVFAQACLECGYGETELFKKYNNPFGMHYAPFLEKFAKPVQYDACDGVGTYAFFNDLDSAIKGYFAWFDGWEHYGDWRAAAKTSPKAFLEHIIPFYCPPGMTKEWASQNGGLNYPDYVLQKILPGITQYIKQPEKITKLIFNRTNDGRPFVTAYQENTPVYTHACSDILEFQRWVKLIGAQLAQVSVQDTSLPIPQVPDFGSVLSTKRRILLNPGHSELHRTGCRSKDGILKEEELNKWQAIVLKQALAQHDIDADIYAPKETDDLSNVGEAAKGYNAFVSLHLNASNHVDHYCCVMVHATEASQSSIRLAEAVTKRCAAAMGSKAFEGAYKNGLSVLRAAEAACQGPCILTELLFLDAYEGKDIDAIQNRLTVGLKELAATLNEHLK